MGRGGSLLFLLVLQVRLLDLLRLLSLLLHHRFWGFRQSHHRQLPSRYFQWQQQVGLE